MSDRKNLPARSIVPLAADHRKEEHCGSQSDARFEVRTGNLLFPPRHVGRGIKFGSSQHCSIIDWRFGRLMPTG